MLAFLKQLFRPSADMRALVKDGALIVDVRSKGEYQSGHINGSTNIPLDNIRQHIDRLKKANKPVITVCQSGGRSSMARSILKQAGIDCYNGGSWRSFQGRYL